MTARLYFMALSHPSQAARKMLDLKNVDYQIVNVLPLNQRVHLRLVGFRGGTVPALKLDGRRIQGSRQIARVLEDMWPEPALFPADPALRAKVVDAERWGEEVLQPVPRRIGRYGAARSFEARLWAGQVQGMPAANLLARTAGPLISYYNRTIETDGRRATEAGVRADLAALPALLDHADRLLGDGTLALAPPNAATLQVLSSVCVLDGLSDLHEHVGGRPCATEARRLFPDYPRPLPPCLPAEWLEPLRR